MYTGYTDIEKELMSEIESEKGFSLKKLVRIIGLNHLLTKNVG